MALGMSYSEFWDGDVYLVRTYRKAYGIRKEIDNYKAWLQGLYIYEAICDASPILRAFSKARKPAPYPHEPYALNTEISKKRRETSEERRRKAEDEIFVANMNAWAESFNKRFTEQQKAQETEEQSDEHHKGGEINAG